MIRIFVYSLSEMSRASKKTRDGVRDGSGREAVGGATADDTATHSRLSRLVSTTTAATTTTGAVVAAGAAGRAVSSQREHLAGLPPCLAADDDGAPRPLEGFELVAPAERPCEARDRARARASRARARRERGRAGGRSVDRSRSIDLDRSRPITRPILIDRS